MENVSLRGTSRFYFRTTFVQYLYMRCFLKNREILPLQDLRITILLTSIRQIRRLCEINLQEALGKLFQLFFANYPVANVYKYHLKTSSKTAVDIYVSHATVSNERKVKLLGINLEFRLNFGFHEDIRS